MLLPTRLREPASPATRGDFLLLRDLRAVRSRIGRFNGLWEQRWERFASRSLAADDRFLCVAFLALVRDDAATRRRLREVLAGAEGWYRGLLEIGHQDTDTWMHSAKLMRLALALDWSWDLGVIDERDRRRLIDTLLRDALANAYVVLHHRVPAHANNQGLAMSLHLTVLGLLFGVRRDRDPLARHLLGWGLHHLPTQIAWLPPGGYSGEGSTYASLIADPLMALACELMEQASGVEVFKRSLAPSAVSVRQVLELNGKLRGPSGLLLPWNQHGFTRTHAGTTAAWWSRRTGDPTTYAKFLAAEGWDLCESFAWADDDHLWQLLFMPEPAAIEGVEPEQMHTGSWVEDHVAGALRNTEETLQLTQIFNGPDRMPVRRHVHPNAIHLEAWESPLTVDGNSHAGFPLLGEPRMQWTNYYSRRPETTSWAQGSVAAHSCVIPDGHEAMVPEAFSFNHNPDLLTFGRVLRWEPTGERPLIAADVTDFYRKPIGAEAVTRTSCLVDDAFWIVRDEIRCDRPQDFTWQLVTRPGSEPTAGGVRLRTAEAVVLDVLHVEDRPVEIHDVPGFPTKLEGRCQHLRVRAGGSHVRFTAVLIPRLGREQLADWSRGWSGLWTDSDRFDGGAAAWRRVSRDGCPLRLEETHPVASGPRHLWLTRRCHVPAGAGNDDEAAADAGAGRLLLELPRALRYAVYIDDRPVPVPSLAGEDPTPRSLAPFLDVTDLVTPGREARITLGFPEMHAAGLLGGVRLHRTLHVPAAELHRDAEGLEVLIGGTRTRVDLRGLDAEPSREAEAFPRGESMERFREELLAGVMAGAAGVEAAASAGDGSDPGLGRARACLAVTDPADRAGVERLVEGLEDADFLVQMVAARVLGSVVASAGGGRGSLRGHAASVLREKLGRELATASGDADGSGGAVRVREMCVVALGELGDRAASGVIAGCLRRDEFYGLRRIAADVLGGLGDPSVLPVLEAWARDSDPETQGAAERSIRRLRGG